MSHMNNLLKLILLVAIIVFGSYTLLDYHLFSSESNDENTLNSSIFKVSEISTEEHFNLEESVEMKESFAVLILGVDNSHFKQTRSDTIMLGLVDPINNNIKLLSIYRDLYTEIPGKGYGKINAAFNYGGVDLTAKTIEELFGIPIKYYTAINFEGFRDLVDAIGGLNVEVEKDITVNKDSRIDHDKIQLKKGSQMLNGNEALSYVRFRNDGEGDFGRTRRQRQVIQELADQTIDIRNATKITAIYNAIEDNFLTNIKNIDLVKLGIAFKDIKLDDVEIIEFDAAPTSRNGVSYVEATDEELNKIKQLLQDELK